MKSVMAVVHFRKSYVLLAATLVVMWIIYVFYFHQFSMTTMHEELQSRGKFTGGIYTMVNCMDVQYR